MTIQDALYAHLAAYASLSALVGTRIAPELLEQGQVYPAVTYDLNVEPIRTMGGIVAKTATGTIVGHDTTFDGARAVAVQVAAALENFVGTMGGGVTVLGSFLRGESENTLQLSADRTIFEAVTEFEITYLP